MAAAVESKVSGDEGRNKAIACAVFKRLSLDPVSLLFVTHKSIMFSVYVPSFVLLYMKEFFPLVRILVVLEVLSVTIFV